MRDRWIRGAQGRRRRCSSRAFASWNIAAMTRPASPSPTEAGMQVVRCRGKLSSLEDMVAREPPPGSVGIGHTRWATHGRPSRDQRAPAQVRAGRGRAQRHHREPPGAARAAGSGGAQVLVGDRHRDRRAPRSTRRCWRGAPTPGGGGAHGARAGRGRLRARGRVREAPRSDRRREERVAARASASARARPSSRRTSRRSSSTRARSSSSRRATSPRSRTRASS